jgi:hypothetical protein
MSKPNPDLELKDRVRGLGYRWLGLGEFGDLYLVRKDGKVVSSIKVCVDRVGNDYKITLVLTTRDRELLVKAAASIKAAIDSIAASEGFREGNPITCIVKV